MHLEKQKKNITKAFTLIELLVVIVIIGILATISTATFSGSREKADEAKMIAERRDSCQQQLASCISAQAGSCNSFENCMNGLVTIDLGGGNTQTWQTQNVNTGTRIDLAVANAQGGLQPGQKLCYDDLESNCDIHGGIYSSALKATICPDGFGLPTVSEYGALRLYLGATHGYPTGYYSSFPLANSIVAIGETSATTNSDGLGFLLGGYASGTTFYGNGSWGMYFTANGPFSQGMAFIPGTAWNTGPDIIFVNSNAPYSQVRCLKD